MAIVKISDVVTLRESSDAVRAFELDIPQPGTTVDTYTLPFYGWIAGRERAPTGVRISAGGNQERNFPLNAVREDALTKHPETFGAPSNGFQLAIGTARLPRQFELQMQARFGDVVDVPFFTVKGMRRALPPVPESALQPIILTTIGRTGGTWATHLLDQHPAIMCHAPFANEVRTAVYWTEIFATLSGPQSFLQSIRAEVIEPEWWLGHKRVSPASLNLREAHSLEQWMASDRIEELAGVVADRIEIFYKWIARHDRRFEATHFVEKCWPSAASQDILFDIYPGAREIFLVRDFRDVLASIVAYNQKRGYDLFNRDEFSDEAEFVSRLRSDAEAMQEAYVARKDQALLLRYEDLISDERGTVTRILDYLGVDSGEATVEGMLQTASEARLNGQEAHRTSATAAESIGRWTRDLDPSFQIACDTAFEEVHAVFGY
jgi:sulfotransferase family protein